MKRIKANFFGRLWTIKNPLPSRSSQVVIDTRAEQSRALSAQLPALAYCKGLRNEIEARDPGALDAATDFVASAIADKHGQGEVAAKTQAHVIMAVV